jgi:iron only hydrogenase large subunit-like protein
MSAILSADDLNDFISPGVACIKPVETLPVQAPTDTSSPLEHEVILDGQQAAAGAPPAQISLTDCLACSGCVTSAEAVLVSLQSHAEVLNALDSGPALRVVEKEAGSGTWMVEGLEDATRRLYVASVSPQTRASLAATCGGGVTAAQAGQMIDALLMGGQEQGGLRAGGRWGNGFAWTVDTNTAREACLVLGSDEVLGGGEEGVSPAPVQPVLTSSCPGWVCYAEKTHPHVLPHLSKVKSPQALMGTLLKTTLSRTLGIPPDRIWHLAIMPCFDKKLEASREELTDATWAGQDSSSGRGVRDVDCVITSKEILMLAESRGIDFFSLPCMTSRQPRFPDAKIDRFLFHSHKTQRKSRSTLEAGGTSGGNLYFVLQAVQNRHAGSQIQMARGRNADVVEYNVTSASGEVIFRAARFYGFRNIQNLVRRLKPAKPSRMPGGKPFGSARRVPAGKSSSGPDYSYVEVMACPGGCTNGGGQIKVDDRVIIDRKGLTSKPGPDEQKQWLAQVDEAYFSADDSDSTSDVGSQSGDLCHIRGILGYWSSVTGIGLHRLAFTSFREVISDVGKNKPTDTERVVQLAGKIGGGW